MAHFAELDDNNVVKRVIVVHNNELLDENGVEQEEKGIEFCQNLLGGRWIQTSYNKTFRKRFAGFGMIYDEQNNEFMFAKPYPSWVWSEAEDYWVAPVSRPGLRWAWDEYQQAWIEPENWIDSEA